MSTRSITPSRSCSAPIGISVATAWGPKAFFSCSSARKKSARSRSSMFTNSIRAMSSSAARAHRRAVDTSTPITALTTNTADSHTRSAPNASATKLGSPGVSSTFILRSFQSNELSAVEIDICRACSSGSASETVLPSGTDPSRLIAPASYSSASCSDVLPAPRWPTSATLRMRSAGGRSPWGGMQLSFLGLCRHLSVVRCSGPDRPRRAPVGRVRRGSLLEGLLLHARPQSQDGLRVHLRDAGLGHAQHLPDLAERQVLVVVQGDHELLALG